jgi:hypothetical protein
MATIQDSEYYIKRNIISSDIIAVNNNCNTSASEADEEENDSHSPGSSITNLGYETPLPIRKVKLEHNYKENIEVDFHGVNKNLLRIKKCQSLKTLNFDFKNDNTEDEEDLNFLEQQLSSSRNQHEVQKIQRRSFSNQSLSLIHPPQYELIGSKVVRGPDFKWNKQDGFFFYFILFSALELLFLPWPLKITYGPVILFIPYIIDLSNIYLVLAGLCDQTMTYHESDRYLIWSIYWYCCANVPQLFSVLVLSFLI